MRSVADLIQRAMESISIPITEQVDVNKQRVEPINKPTVLEKAGRDPSLLLISIEERGAKRVRPVDICKLDFRIGVVGRWVQKRFDAPLMRENVGDPDIAVYQRGVFRFTKQFVEVRTELKSSRWFPHARWELNQLTV